MIQFAGTHWSHRWSALWYLLGPLGHLSAWQGINQQKHWSSHHSTGRSSSGNVWQLSQRSRAARIRSTGNVFDSLTGLRLYPECMLPESQFPDNVDFTEFTYPDHKIDLNSTPKGCILDPGPRGWWIRPVFSWDKWICDKDMVGIVVFGIMKLGIKT